MPSITVERPVTHSSWEDGKYTTYDIRIDCRDDSCPLFSLPQSCIARRYSEFKWLRKRMKLICSAIEVPTLPPTGCFLTDRFSPEFIEKRRIGLEEFVLKIYSIPTLLSEAAFHLFVQTDLSPAEIDGYINREWGKNKEVTEIINELNQRRLNDERDEISSIASCSRWSDASAFSYLHDLDDESPTGSSTAINEEETQRHNAELSMNSAISPIIGLYVPQNNSSDLLSPHCLSGRSQSAAVLSRRVAELRGDENSSGNYLSSSRPIPLTPDGRRTKLYCSNAIMYSSSYDDRQNTSPFARIAHIEESVRRSSENS